MKKIAVIGSRKWPSPQQVALKINALYGEHGQFMLVSGFGPVGSTNYIAENTALEFGIPVVSFRPVKIAGGREIPDEYGVDEWRLYRGTGKIVHHHVPVWAAYEGALFYRSMMIADRADEGVAFWDGFSRGTAAEIEMFEGREKSLEIVKP